MATMSALHVPVAVHTDDPISRAGLMAQLRHRPEVRLVDGGEAEGGVTVVLADDIDAEILQLIRAHRRASRPIVLVVARLDDHALMAAVEAGVSSLLLRSAATTDALIEALRSAAVGGGSMPSELLGRLCDQVRRLQSESGHGHGVGATGFTEREIRGLGLVAEGYDTAEIGRRLFCSERTVKNVIHGATTRLDLRNRTHAVAHALRLGII
jgi:DNA-binding NarL/FixJ family response regulator